MFNKRQHRQHGKSAAHPPCRLGAGAHTKPIYLLPPSHRHHKFKGKALQRAPVLTGQPDPLLPAIPASGGTTTRANATAELCLIPTISLQTLLFFHMEPRRPWGKCYFYSPVAPQASQQDLSRDVLRCCWNSEWDILAAEASAHENSSNSSSSNILIKSERPCFLSLPPASFISPH